jgi:hypothetical protein
MDCHSGKVRGARNKLVDEVLDVLDGLVREFWTMHAYEELPGVERLDGLLCRIADARALDARLDDRQRAVLRTHACWHADRAVAENDPERLVRGLVALSLAWIEGPGNRYLVLFGRAARLMRLFRERVFEQAAALVGEPAAAILRAYAREAPAETARLLRRLGFRETRDEKGFRFEEDLSKTGWV